MPINRRAFLSAALAAGTPILATAQARPEASKSRKPLPSLEALDRAAAAPVLKREALTSPVVIDSIRLLKKDKDFLVHVRSRDGAEGVSLTDPGRANYLAPS